MSVKTCIQFRTPVSVAVVMDSDKLDVETEVVDILTPSRKTKRLIPSRRRNSGMFGR